MHATMEELLEAVFSVFDARVLLRGGAAIMK
jgi:hypothetical protein